MIQITCNGNSARCTGIERLTSGMVGLQCEFVFDSAWDGLARTAVFIAGSEQRDVLLIGDICTVPWEVLKNAGYHLTVGVYGTNAAGTLVIPTVYADCGGIHAGAKPEFCEPAEPTQSIAAQIIEAIKSAVGCPLFDENKQYILSLVPNVDNDAWDMQWVELSMRDERTSNLAGTGQAGFMII